MTSKAVLLLFLVFWKSCRDLEAKVPIHIGGFFPLSPNKASVPGHALLAAAKLALKHVNNSGILQDHELRMIVKDSKCDPAYSANMFMDLMMDKRVSLIILGAACSDVTEILAELSAYRHLAQVSYASRSLVLSNRAKYPTLFRTLPSESARNLARVEWIQQFGWKNIAMLYEKTSSDLAAQSNHQVIEELKKLNCSIVLSEQITDNQLDLNMKTLMRNDARIIVGTFYESKARQIFCEAYKTGVYGPRYVWLLIGTYSYRWWTVRDAGLDCTLDEMQAAVAYSFIFNNQIFLGDDDEGNARRAISGVTQKEYFKQYKTYLNAVNITKAPNITAYAYDAVWVIAAALNQSLPAIHNMGERLENFSRDPRVTKVFVSAIQNIQFQGITGEVEFFHDGDRYDGMVQILQQHPDGRAVSVGFYHPKHRQVKLEGTGNLWPDGKIPLDRTITVRQFIQIPLWLYVFVCMMSSLGIVLGLVFLAFNIKFRKKRYIKLSSPNLNNVVILGCILVYSTVFLYGLDGRVSEKIYTTACRARFCLLSLGFTLGFGAMFSKTWRVHQIFTNVKKVRKVVRDKDLFGMLGVIMLVDVLLLTLWMSFHPPNRNIIIMDASRKISKDRDHEIVMCREECSGPHSLPWLVTFYAFHSLLLVFGLFLAFETRKISVPILNDSRFIGISVYNVVLLCAIGVPLSHVSSSEPAAGFALICAVILFCTTVTLSVLFIPKVIQMWKDPDGNPLQGTMIPARGQPSTAHENSMCTRVSKRHSRLEAEVSVLQMQNKQLKGKLSELNQNAVLLHVRTQSLCDLSVSTRDLSRQKGSTCLLNSKLNNFEQLKDGEFSRLERPSDPESDATDSANHRCSPERERLLSNPIPTCYVGLASSPDIEALRRRSLPSPGLSSQSRGTESEMDDLMPEGSRSTQDLEANHREFYKRNSMSCECVMNSTTPKCTTACRHSSSGSKINGYGLRVYCVKTRC